MTTTDPTGRGVHPRPRPRAPAASLPPRARLRPRRPGRALGIGVVGLWLTVIVLLPLAALTVASFDDGLAASGRR